MRLRELTLQNWGPFYGYQSINFECSETAPVILVHGENMRGKTSILRALRWVLYGEVEGFDGKQIEISGFANYGARDEEKDFQFGATLSFEHQGKILEISRMVDAVGQDTVCRIGQQHNYMRIIGGDPIPEKSIDEYISRVLHKDISEFFLFDGETLNRFEERLRNDDATSVFLRKRIEMALGVPALRYLREDITALIAETSTQVKKASAAARTHKDKSQELDALDQSIDSCKTDLAEMQENLSESSNLLREQERQMEQIEAIRDIVHSRRAKEELLEDYVIQRQGSEAELALMLDKNWWVPLASRLNNRAQEAQKMLEQGVLLGDRRSQLTHDIGAWSQQLHHENCDTCNQKFPADQMETLRFRVANAELERDQIQQPDLESLAHASKSLAKFLDVSNVLERIEGYEADISRLRMREFNARSEIESLTQKIEGNTVDVYALEKNVQQLRELVFQFEKGIADSDEKLKKFQQQHAQIIREIASLVPSASAAKAQLEVLEQLGDAVDGAIDGFREGMRMKVQIEASGIFKLLTSEADYQGLRIDGNYYLKIVDENDRVIDLRSAGADQIVTMSLIGALAKCAVDEGPIVMDTPLGRLDQRHRNNILNWISTMGSQVILFVQSGEFNRSRDLPQLGGRVGREYMLRREGSSRTRIEVMLND